MGTFRTSRTGRPLLALVTRITKFCNRSSSGQGDFVGGTVPCLHLISNVDVGTVTDLTFNGCTTSVPSSLRGNVRTVRRNSGSFVSRSLRSVVGSRMRTRGGLSALGRTLGGVTSAAPIVLLVSRLSHYHPSFTIVVLRAVGRIFSIGGIRVVLVAGTRRLGTAVGRD